MTTLVVAPDLMFSDGNPLLLTADGEFVAKNVVLIAATLVLIGHPSKAAEPVSGSCDTCSESGVYGPAAGTLAVEPQIA